MPRWHSWSAAVWGILALGAAPNLCNANSPRPSRRVLILHSFGQQFEPFRTVATAFRTELSQQSPYPIEYYEVSLETARFAEGDVDQPLADYVRSLCARQPMDLVVPMGSPAFRFAVRHHTDLFPEVPVLGAGIEQRHLLGMPLGTNTTALAAAATAPMFGFFEHELGHGIVGGRMISAGELGLRSADVAIRILAGEPAGSIPIVSAPPATPIFDRRELKRWGIHASQLPAGSEVRFVQPTLWQTYRWRFIALVGLVGLEALLILLLMRNHERLRTTRAELLKNEENIRLAARAARLGFWTLDIDHDLLWITDEGRDLFGWSKAEAVGFKRFLGTLRSQDREPAKRAIRRALEGGAEFEAEHQIVLGDGSERWIATRGRAQKNAEGEPMLLSGVSMDITSRKQAVHEAQELRRELSHTGRLSLLSQFTASLAHELGQPLGAIQHNAEAAELFLKASPPDLEEIRSILSDVRKDCERAGMVIDRLRAMLRRRAIEAQSLVWSELAHEAVGLVRADSQARGISLEIETPLGLPHLKGDRVHIEQVLINLVANAMDAIDTHPNGERRVTISARSDGNGTVECSVKDTGPGIAPQCLSGIFDPFVTTKANGMGMGLPISQTIVETMGGRLWAENNPGTGATFRFTIPVAES